MFALVRREGMVGWADVASPIVGPLEVRVAPRLVGICRTDIAVATGRLPVAEPRILGHEFVGDVVEVGSAVSQLAVGDRVSIDPTISCGDCRRCRDGWPLACKRRRFMGVDCDGALAESVVVPARNAWAMPSGMADGVAAMFEPVAACAAVLKAPVGRNDRGLINGDGRLTQLTRQILSTRGIDRIDSAEQADEESAHYDFAIDTLGDSDSIGRLLGMLRPGGLLVIKSRPVEPISLCIRELLPAEPVIHVVNYGAFSEARRLLADRELDVSLLLGPVWPVAEYEAALMAASQDEQFKHFIALPTHRFHRLNSTAIESGIGVTS